MDEVKITFTGDFYGPDDHLGSTRMVLADNGQIVEATMYTPYGMMDTVAGISTAGLNAREKFTTKEFDEDGADSANGVDGIQAYYFGARYYDPEIGYWISTDPSGQFWSGYSYVGNGANPILMVDEDGNFIFSLLLPGVGTIIDAACWGAVIGGGLNAGTQLVTTGNVDWGKVGAAALGGAVAGGFGTMGSSLAANIFWGTMGNVASYTTTTPMLGGELTAGGYAGAILGGMAGGLIPGFQGVEGGVVDNIVSEIAYSGMKGSVVGMASGGIGALLDQENVGEGMKRGAIGGMIGGAVGAGLKIGLMGPVSQKSQYQILHEKAAEQFYDTQVGIYGSVNRSGGLIRYFNKYANGGSWGRNNVNYNRSRFTENEIFTHENIHHVQQSASGVIPFYFKTGLEQLFEGNDAYKGIRFNEFKADFLQ